MIVNGFSGDGRALSPLDPNSWITLKNVTLTSTTAYSPSSWIGTGDSEDNTRCVWKSSDGFTLPSALALRLTINSFSWTGGSIRSSTGYKEPCKVSVRAWVVGGPQASEYATQEGIKAVGKNRQGPYYTDALENHFGGFLGSSDFCAFTTGQYSPTYTSNWVDLTTVVHDSFVSSTFSAGLPIITNTGYFRYGQTPHEQASNIYRIGYQVGYTYYITLETMTGRYSGPYDIQNATCTANVSLDYIPA